MAVLDTLPGITVSILINGQLAEEFIDGGEEVDGPLAPVTVVKYIEAISDTEFAIKPSIHPVYWENRQNVDDFIFQVWIDGKWAAGSYCLNETVNISVPWFRHIEGFAGKDLFGRSTIHPFKFADVEIVEVADKAIIDKDVKAAAALGEIKVLVFRVAVGAVINGRAVLPSQALSEISEKAVKGRALSHGTAFGVARITPQRCIRDCIYLDGIDKPLAYFTFRYRSKEALRQLLVIPRSPSPDPFDALPAAERERLARDAFQQQQSPKPEPGIKSERMVKRERSNTGIVDLTGDAPTAKQRKTTMQTPIDLTED